VEKLVTLSRRGAANLHARRLALAQVRDETQVKKLFDGIGPRMGDRTGGYTRIIRTGFAKGNGAEKAFL